MRGEGRPGTMARIGTATQLLVFAGSTRLNSFNRKQVQAVIDPVLFSAQRLAA